MPIPPLFRSYSAPALRTTRGMDRLHSAGRSLTEQERSFFADQAQIQGVPTPELTPKVRAAIYHLLGEVLRLKEELKSARKRIIDLENLADHDSLTPILNRRGFTNALARAASYTERYGVCNSLIFFDVNGLKAINDRYGHQAGDQALIAIAQALRQGVRPFDFVGRLGGDEFAVALVRMSGRAAQKKAADLAALIARKTITNSEGEQVAALSVAYGLHAIASGEEVAEALSAADQAMYAAKRKFSAHQDNVAAF